MKDKIIVQSRLKWWVYPVILAAFFLLFAFCTETFWDFIGVILNGKGIKLVGIILIILVVGFGAVWFMMRRVKVYNDRIEVKYLLHRNWNYQIMLKDVDCCCFGTVMDENGDNKYLCKRIYLLTGRKLWFYISDSNGSNFDEMLSVLTDHFGIPIRKGGIYLSSEENDTVEKGEYISVEDIKEEELSAMAEQRRLRPHPCSEFKTSRYTKWKYFYIVYGLILFIAVSVAIYSIGKAVLLYFKEMDTVTLSYIDAKTEIPARVYYTVDSIDVDSNVVLGALKTSVGDNDVLYRAFRVKGRNDVWVYVGLEDRDEIPSSVFYDTDYLIGAFHQKHTYKNVTDDDEYKDLKKKIVKNQNINADDNFLLLVLDDVKNIKTGRTLYFDAIAESKRKNGADDAFRLMKQAAEEVPAAQYELGLMYEYGKGTAADSVQAFSMYELAAGQSDDPTVKIDALNRLSYFYARRHQYAEAIALIDRAIEVASDSAITAYPDKANLYDSKGEHQYRSGDKEGAAMMWKRVMELDPQFLDNHDSDLYRMLYGK